MISTDDKPGRRFAFAGRRPTQDQRHLTPLLLRRLAAGLVSLFIVTALVFTATEFLPGDAAEAALGRGASEETLRIMRERLALDQPAPLRYLDWLSGIAVGDFGVSLLSGRDISALINDRVWNTLLLAGVALAISVPLALTLGILSALYAGGIFDRTVSFSTLGAIAMPEFLLAAVLILLFAITLDWFPALSLLRASDGLAETAAKLALPVMTLVLVVLAHMTRLTRTVIANALGASYVELALLKGVPPKRIVLVHILPNVVAPLLNIIALVVAYLIAGVVVVESVFGFPGLGRLMVDAVTNRDVPLVQACGLIFGCVFVLANIVADILGTIANPRLRVGA